MEPGRVVLVATLLVTTVLTGCVGGADGGDEELKRTAAVTESLGGIQGVVADTAVQPVEGANITLAETNETIQTAADGSYAFNRISPGTYTVVFRADGFVSAREEVTVRAGEVSLVDVLLTHLQSEEAYTQAFELAGFFECGVETGWDLQDEAPEPPGPIDPRFFFLGVAVCAVPNFVLEEVTGGGNATNDRFLHLFEFEPPLNTVVYEMTWESNSQFSDWMTTRMEVEGFANDAIGTVFRTQGPSPIQVRLEKPVWTNLSANFTEACENETRDDSDDYCGYGFWDAGWPMQTRVFPAWQCQSEDAGVCVVAQQEFTHFVTAFYNGPAPEGYTALSGS